MDGKMEKAIQTMAEAVQAILHEKMLAFYLFGSLVLHDFKPGWSDVDFLCLTDGQLTGKQAEDLLTLRQALVLESAFTDVLKGPLFHLKSSKPVYTAKSFTGAPVGSASPAVIPLMPSLCMSSSTMGFWSAAKKYEAN